MRTTPAERAGRPPAPTAAFLRARVLLPVDVLLALVTVLVAAVRFAGGSVPPTLQYIPFIASLVLLGVPHGAIDHLVPSRLAAARPTAAQMLAVVGVYFVLGGADLALWTLAPAVGFLAFIALTWFHWGQGDVWAALALEGRSSASRSSMVALLVARGGIPMLVPLITQPGAYSGVIASTSGLFAPSAAALLAPLTDVPARIAAAVVLGAAILIERVAAQRTTPAEWWRASGETALLVVFFAVVPPVLAIGLYFCLWHSVRHIVRLQLLDPPALAAVEGGRVWPAAVRFARASAPLTAAAIVLLVALALVLPARTGLAALLGVYLVLISALTVPHVFVVGLMDRRQLVWREPSAPLRTGP